MNKAESIAALEVFRQSVMLSTNTLPVDDSVKANIVVRFQGFYLSMLHELIAENIPPIVQSDIISK